MKVELLIGDQSGGVHIWDIRQASPRILVRACLCSWLLGARTFSQRNAHSARVFRFTIHSHVHSRCTRVLRSRSSRPQSSPPCSRSPSTWRALSLRRSTRAYGYQLSVFCSALLLSSRFRRTSSRREGVLFSRF